MFKAAAICLLIFAQSASSQQVVVNTLDIGEIIDLPNCGGTVELRPLSVGFKIIYKKIKRCSIINDGKVALSIPTKGKRKGHLEASLTLDEPLRIGIHSADQKTIDVFEARPFQKTDSSVSRVDSDAHIKSRNDGLNIKIKTPTHSISISSPTPNTNDPLPNPSPSQAISEPNKVQACVDAFDGSLNEQTCLELTAKTSRAVSLINICEESFNGDDNELACIRYARRYYEEAVNRVKQCQAMSTEDQRLACLHH